jgi:hypothetical protein
MKHNKLSNFPLDICNITNNLIQSKLSSVTYKKYNAFITNSTNKFTHNNSQLIQNLFNIKLTTPQYFKFTFKYQSLTEYTKIPPFIDIFKYLYNNHNKDFILQFTNTENIELKSKFAGERNKNTNTQIYDFLNRTEIGNKLSNIYYNLPETVKNDLHIKFPSVIFHNLLINSFTSYKIIEDLENNIKKLVTFDINYKNKEYPNLVYLFMYGKHKMNKNEIKIIGNKIIERILFFNELLKTDKMPEKLIFFMTDKKKIIDDNVINNMHFKTLNINTAVTNGNDIIIYREQELLKSIFHELIHFHNLDFRECPPQFISYLTKSHNINVSSNKYLIYEAVTESMANILNNIYVSRDIEEFQNNLINEILFSTLQMSKILKVCKYNNWKEFAQPDIIGYDNEKQFKQDSCVLSYYILKLYILLYLDVYFKKIINNKLQFINLPGTFTNLRKIFDNARYNNLLEKVINELLNTLQKLNTNTLKSKHYKINKTLRMTCLEDKKLSKTFTQKNII